MHVDRSEAASLGSDTRDAYTRRAAEYTELLGSMESVHAADRLLVTSWADRVRGPVIDAGCGPGHWTAHLAERRVPVRGIDLVPAFIAAARVDHPGVRFDVGSIDALDAAADSVDGVLAWYSLIHHEPHLVQQPLREIARVLAPGGELLLGFFEGPVVERFEHAVTPAYRWPVSALSDELHAAGLDVVETHTRTGPAHSPHGAIIARRASP